jgi:hypothetical protein
MTTSERIDAFMAQPARALVGASRQKHHFGNAALRTLREKGSALRTVRACAAAWRRETSEQK